MSGQGSSDTVALDQQSVTFANRAADLAQRNPWMDHQAVLTLAQQQTPDNELQQQAQQIGDTLAQTWDGYQHAFFDPTLQAQPSTAQAVADYLHATLGPPAVSSGSITQLQAALAKDGFLGANAVNGVWDSASESAYNQAVNTYKQDMLAGGHKPLTSKVSSLVHSLFHDATHPWDAVSGWYDSVAQAVGDVSGAVAGTGDDLMHGTLGSDRGKALFDSVSQHTMNALTSGNTSAAAQKKIHENPLNILGDVVSVSGATSVLKSAAKGVVEQAGKRALGNAAVSIEDHAANVAKLEKIGAAISGAHKLGFVGNSINDIGNALRAGTLASTDPAVQRAGLGIVTKSLLKTPGAALKAPNALVSATWAKAVPGLARLAPVTAPLAELGGKLGGLATGGDALAYKIKNFVALPYKYAPVRALGIANQRAMIGSLAAHGIAGALPGTQLQQNITRQNTGLDSWLHNNTINVIPGLHIELSDLLMGPLHGDLVGAGRGSKVVGDMVNGFTNSVADKMGKLGAPAAFQTALGLSRNQLMDLAGGDSTRLLTWMNDKFNQYAADTYAQRTVAANFTGGKAEEADALRAAKESWYSMSHPERQQWVADMTKADPHFQGLQTRIKADLLRNTVDPKAAVRKSLDEYFANTRDMQDLHASGAFHYLIGPRGHAALEAGGADVGHGDLAHLTHHPDGAIGLQGTDIATKEEILDRDVPALQAAYDSAVTPALREAAVNKMVDYLHEQFNMDASSLGVFHHNPASLIEQITKRADERASEMLPTFDQPQWVQDRIAALKAKGKRVVVGAHIGHAYDGTMPQLTTLEGWKTPIRKWAGKVALDPQRIPDVEMAKSIEQSKDANIHHFLTDDPKARLATEHADFRTVRAVLGDKAVKNELNPVFSAALALTSRVGMNKTIINKTVEDSGGILSRAEARAQLENGMAAQFGIRDISKKKLIDRLMTDHTVTGPHGEFEWKGVDQYTATGIVNAAHAAYRQPGYMMGLEAVENWARAGFGIGDRLIQRNPNNPLYRAVSNWPNSLLRARNQLRFTVSPLFDLRRLFKQDYKMVLEGVKPTANPLQDLMDQGVVDEATTRWSRVSGHVPDEQMDADRYALSRSIFGLYDPQWHGAYFAHELAKQGKTNAEITDAYNRVFKYGADGGRTGLERTTNTIFFPFSFEKTLLRNTGGYLLDHPGQALALDNAVEAWRQLDKNGEVGQWVSDHLPILKEMQLLNAFSHGISPGQFGGINAPIIGSLVKGGSTAASDLASGKGPAGKSEALLNLLLPQSWGVDFTKKNLAKYLPIWGQFSKVAAAAFDQIRIGQAAAHDTVASVMGYNWAPEPTLTPQAQIGYALRKKAQLITDPAMKSIIDYNNQQSDIADKYTWPESPKLPQSIWGQPIDRTTIGEYMQYLYPAYNPQKAADFAVAAQAQAKQFIAHVKKTDPDKAKQLEDFRLQANKVIGHLNRDDYDSAQAAQTQSQFHAYARELSATDPTWFKFYETFYARALGPIRSPDGKGAGR